MSGFCIEIDKSPGKAAALNPPCSGAAELVLMWGGRPMTLLVPLCGHPSSRVAAGLPAVISGTHSIFLAAMQIPVGMQSAKSNGVFV